ncbi:DNA replication protein Cdc24 [Schizosaccharomyces japonicus yFS275]|uniref:DNA replication protein Cdc24 n=1 Tax=Schizosaccharomyces japonicus (strain yFS275 / FY16936) TaxID=402676 RepID=B6JXW1_SCHJY|nr:DNA replication protein Cdc24 [Schizosaccharomyces japonicus yFS275]EEB06379.2 DNA replication protein Cdc24 [Schizosaccharomyces japonicus yFS275]
MNIEAVLNDVTTELKPLTSTLPFNEKQLENIIVTELVNITESFSWGISRAVLLTELEQKLLNNYLLNNGFSSFISTDRDPFHYVIKALCYKIEFGDFSKLYLKDMQSSTEGRLTVHSNFFLYFHPPYDILIDSQVRFTNAPLYPICSIHESSILNFLPTQLFIPIMNTTMFQEWLEKTKDLNELEYTVFLITDIYHEDVNQPSGGSRVCLKELHGRNLQELLNTRNASDYVTLTFRRAFRDYVRLLNIGELLVIPNWKTVWEQTTEWFSGMVAFVVEQPETKLKENASYVWVSGRVTKITRTSMFLDSLSSSKKRVMIQYPATNNLGIHSCQRGDLVFFNNLILEENSMEVTSESSLKIVSNFHAPLVSSCLRNPIPNQKRLSMGDSGHVRVRFVDVALQKLVSLHTDCSQPLAKTEKTSVCNVCQKDVADEEIIRKPIFLCTLLTESEFEFSALARIGLLETLFSELRYLEAPYTEDAKEAFRSLKDHVTFTEFRNADIYVNPLGEVQLQKVEIV